MVKKRQGMFTYITCSRRRQVSGPVPKVCPNAKRNLYCFPKHFSHRMSFNSVSEVAIYFYSTVQRRKNPTMYANCQNTSSTLFNPSL